MKKIVVVGGGTMGLDIAHTFARSGHAVVVREISDELAEKSHSRLVAALDKLVARGKMDEAKRAEILGNMTFTTDLAAAADADLVLEAIVENLDVKKSLFQELDGICKADTIFATNTSSISITAIAAATKRPEKVLGMHFFNPAPAMKLVEVIRGARTNDETFQACLLYTSRSRRREIWERVRKKGICFSCSSKGSFPLQFLLFVREREIVFSVSYKN